MLGTSGTIKIEEQLKCFNTLGDNRILISFSILNSVDRDYIDRLRTMTTFSLVIMQTAIIKQ